MINSKTKVIMACIILFVAIAIVIVGISLHGHSITDGNIPTQHAQYASGDDLYYVRDGKLYFYEKSEDKTTYIDDIPANEITFNEDSVYYCNDKTLIEYNIKAKQRKDIYTFDSDFLIYEINSDAVYLGVKQYDETHSFTSDIYKVSLSEKTAELVLRSDYCISNLVDCKGVLYYIEERSGKDIYLSDQLCSYSIENQMRQELIENPVNLCKSNEKVFAAILNDGIYEITNVQNKKYVQLFEGDISSLTADKNNLYFAVCDENAYIGMYAYNLDSDIYEKIFDEIDGNIAPAEQGLYIYQVENGLYYYDFSTKEIKEIKLMY